MSASSLFPELSASPTGESEVASTLGSTQSLYRKYRPQSFGATELVGQDSIVRTLKNAIKLDRVAHAYLFTGPRGTGKTSTARLLAKAVNCLAPDPDTRPCNACAACKAINAGSTTDIIEIDAASNRGIDDIRELRERVKFAPTFLKTKFYIVDEAHQITGAAANAFLKTLEEPPPHTKFILATTDPEQLLPTIVSRCQRFDFKRFPRETIIDHLSRVAEQENVPIDRDALAVIAEHAAGSMRDALGLLDQLASYRNAEGQASQPIVPDDVRSLLGIARSERVVRMAEALANRDPGKGLSLINEAVESGEDPRQLNRQLIATLRATMFALAADAATNDTEIDSLARQFSLAEIARHASRFSEIDFRMRNSPLPQLPLEIAFVQATLDTNSPGIPTVPPATRTQAQRTGQTPALAADQPARAQSRAEQPQNIRSQQAAKSASTPSVAAAPDRAAREPEQPTTREVSQGSQRDPIRPGDPITVDLLHDLWPKIRLDIKARDRRIEALLSSCDPAAVNGASITLVTNYKFHWEKMNEDASRALIESVIGRLVNQQVTVSTEIRNGNGLTAASGATERDEARNGQQGASDSESPVPLKSERSSDEQSLIDAAKKLFDAEELSPQQ